MKVNTDSLILGSYAGADAKNAMRILDIGTGTGILALMMAQQSSLDTRVDAVELDITAAKQASENFIKSAWRERLHVLPLDITAYAPDTRYDLIIANPPYFDTPDKNTNAYKLQNASRFIARQTGALSPSVLSAFARKYLNKNGVFWCVYPFQVRQNILDCARLSELEATVIVEVKHNLTSDPYLNVFRFQRLNNDGAVTRAESCQLSRLFIKNSDGTYTDDYRALCSEYYLNF